MEKHTLNIENGLEMMGGDSELYCELIEEFLNTGDINIEELTNLAKTNNYEKAASKVHRIKGSSAAIGGERLQELRTSRSYLQKKNRRRSDYTFT